MSDPRAEFVARIDLSKTRVRSFEGFVLLCGGALSKDPAPIKSVRHMIYGELTSGRHSKIATRLKMAEEIQDWFQAGAYSDLVTFEEHLAGLSDVIVLIVESAGAVAELGVFSVSQAFSAKLLIVIAEHHYELDSFIKLGPLKRLENIDAQSVLVYDWHEDNPGGRVEKYEKLTTELGEIADSINSYLDEASSERNFKKAEPAHTMFLICELCDLFGALAETEISAYLGKAGLNITGNELGQYLFMLLRCDFLKVKSKGHGRYYYAPDWTSRISFGYHPGIQINKDRVRVDVIAHYEENLKSRFTVVQSIRKQM
ncbi:retron St85 family effector protein [Xanthomonas arboricola]|uniref:retron St85 family effector protein n=1 Tax=Xanthomonas arboricola TaxID=56448 RepID=UPI001C613805|nr:retron St85 family effector protein [Xanthomonas arboricola]